MAGDADEKKRAVAAAAKHIVDASNSVVTEVIDKDEDKNPSFVERIMAALGALFICGLTYVFVAIFVLPMAGMAGHGWLLAAWSPPFSPGYWTIVLIAVLVLTVSTCIAAFLSPKSTFRYFGYFLNWLKRNFK